MALYNERVYSHDRMAALDVELDEHPELSGQMIAEDTSNHLAFAELQHYNDKGVFLFNHPIVLGYKRENELDALRKANPERFMNEMVNADKSITRYQSLINNKKYKTEEEKQTFLTHIATYRDKLEVMKRLISSK